VRSWQLFAAQNDAEKSDGPRDGRIFEYHQKGNICLAFKKPWYSNARYERIEPAYRSLLFEYLHFFPSVVILGPSQRW
jgi:hypothetical protein